MTDAQTVVAMIAGAAGTIAGSIRWSTRRRTQSQDQSTAALVENAKHQAVLATKIEALDQQRELTVSVARLEVALATLQSIAAQFERFAETIERDARLDEPQRAKLSKIRDKINRGLLAATPMRPRSPAGHLAERPAGSSDESDGSSGKSDG